MFKQLQFQVLWVCFYEWQFKRLQLETVPSVIVKSEQGPILWNLALIHFSKDAMSMLIVGQITIDIQQLLLLLLLLLLSMLIVGQITIDIQHG